MTTVPDEIVERIRSYLAHNAAKEPRAITELVQTGHDQLGGLLEGLSEEQARFKPGPDDWSVLELLRHVVVTKRGVARVCETLARGEQPAGLGGEGEARAQDGVMGEEFPSLAQARAATQEAHEQLLSFLGRLSPAANTEARFRHFLFGDLNCREWAAFQRIHDGDHAGQIEKIRAAPGFPPT